MGTLDILVQPYFKTLCVIKLAYMANAIQCKQIIRGKTSFFFCMYLYICPVNRGCGLKSSPDTANGAARALAFSIHHSVSIA